MHPYFETLDLGNRIITSLVIKLLYPSASILSLLFQPSSNDSSLLKSLSLNSGSDCIKSFRKNKSLNPIFSCIKIKTRYEIQYNKLKLE